MGILVDDVVFFGIILTLSTLITSKTLTSSNAQLRTSSATDENVDEECGVCLTD